MLILNIDHSQSLGALLRLAIYDYKVWVTPQSDVTSFDVPTEMLVSVRHVTTHPTGLVLDVLFVGSPEKRFSGLCTRSLLKRATPKADRAYVHLCHQPGCSDKLVKENSSGRHLKRIGIHCDFYCPVLLRAAGVHREMGCYRPGRACHARPSRATQATRARRQGR